MLLYDMYEENNRTSLVDKIQVYGNRYDQKNNLASGKIIYKSIKNHFITRISVFAFKMMRSCKYSNDQSFYI